MKIYINNKKGILLKIKNLGFAVGFMFKIERSFFLHFKKMVTYSMPFEAVVKSYQFGFFGLMVAIGKVNGTYIFKKTGFRCNGKQVFNCYHILGENYESNLKKLHFKKSELPF